MTQALPPSSNTPPLAAPPVTPPSASTGGAGFGAAAAAQGLPPPASTGTPATPASPAPPTATATPATPATPATSSVTAPASATQVAPVVAAVQAALAQTVNLSPQAQLAVKLDAFHQLVANLVTQIPAGSATLPGNWPAAGVSPQLQAFVTALLQNATAGQPLPQQLVSLQAWPTALANAVLQLAGQAAAAEGAPPALAVPPQAAQAAGTATADIRLPSLQNWLVQQGVVQGTDGERAFTLSLRVPVAWAQAQAALGAALPRAAEGPGAAPTGAALPITWAGPSTSAGVPSLAGLLQLPFAGSVQQLSSGSMGLVMQPQVLPGTPAAAAAQAMRTSAILQLEFQPLAQAVQSAQAASVYLPAHLVPQEVQAMLQNKATDPWVLMAQAQAEGQGRKQQKNANEQSLFCNRAGCQYQGRALCAQPFCAEMNYLWSVDRAQRR
ncbi:hypothetical protein N5D37_00540 [Comamonas aquatica]|uniref:hypothetical protein n=1 Tax=Comamonas aquatica TaxID=225991 RepID=UPI00244C4FA0|nr:hypothetical protein [Comamonas aquatica]MDH0901177.1 hypothetical protein [Comamonas aquatica]MDH1764208.1 hypothetical protein [Comamonas aquatica]